MYDWKPITVDLAHAAVDKECIAIMITNIRNGKSPEKAKDSKLFGNISGDHLMIKEHSWKSHNNCLPYWYNIIKLWNQVDTYNGSTLWNIGALFIFDVLTMEIGMLSIMA